MRTSSLFRCTDNLVFCRDKIFMKNELFSAFLLVFQSLHLVAFYNNSYKIWKNSIIINNNYVISNVTYKSSLIFKNHDDNGCFVYIVKVNFFLN